MVCGAVQYSLKATPVSSTAANKAVLVDESGGNGHNPTMTSRADRMEIQIMTLSNFSSAHFSMASHFSKHNLVCVHL